jgi:hypothetical protein
MAATTLVMVPMIIKACPTMIGATHGSRKVGLILFLLGVETA